MEVVLAVGIMALGVVTILGLLPHGMQMSRNTANELAETRIIEQIVGEMQASDWQVLDANQGTDKSQRRYFDDQGLELVAQSGDFGAKLSYVAEATVGDLDVRLPNNATAPKDNKNLRRVRVRVIGVPLQNVNFDNPPPGVPVKSFTQLVAKMR